MRHQMRRARSTPSTGWALRWSMCRSGSSIARRGGLEGARAAGASIRATLAAAALALVAAAAAADKPFGMTTVDIVTSTGTHRYEVEVAYDESTIVKGLTGRHQMPANHGMLFMFERREPVQFWMRNVYIPLDILGLDWGGTVKWRTDRAKPLSEDLIPGTEYFRGRMGPPVVCVLELNAGQFAAILFRESDKVIVHDGIIPPGNNPSHLCD